MSRGLGWTPQAANRGSSTMLSPCAAPSPLGVRSTSLGQGFLQAISLGKQSAAPPPSLKPGTVKTGHPAVWQEAVLEPTGISDEGRLHDGLHPVTGTLEMGGEGAGAQQTALHLSRKTCQTHDSTWNVAIIIIIIIANFYCTIMCQVLFSAGLAT